MPRRRPSSPPAPWIEWIAQDWSKPGRTVGRHEELCLTADTRKGHNVLRVGLRHTPLKTHPDADVLTTRPIRMMWYIRGPHHNDLEGLVANMSTFHPRPGARGAKTNPLRPAHQTAVAPPDLVVWARVLKKGPDALSAHLAGPDGAALIDALLTTTPPRDRATAYVAAAVLAHSGTSIAPGLSARLDALGADEAPAGTWRAHAPSALVTAIDRAALVGALVSAPPPSGDAPTDETPQPRRAPRAL